MRHVVFVVEGGESGTYWKRKERKGRSASRQRERGKERAGGEERERESSPINIPPPTPKKASPPTPELHPRPCWKTIGKAQKKRYRVPLDN